MQRNATARSHHGCVAAGTHARYSRQCLGCAARALAPHWGSTVSPALPHDDQSRPRARPAGDRPSSSVAWATGAAVTTGVVTRVKRPAVRPTCTVMRRGSVVFSANFDDGPARRPAQIPWRAGGRSRSPLTTTLSILVGERLAPIQALAVEAAHLLGQQPRPVHVEAFAFRSHLQSSTGPPLQGASSAI